MEKAEDEIQNITVVGTGVIGNGWITRFLANGYDVIAYDPAENAEEKTKQAIKEVWPTLEQVGLVEGASIDRLTFAESLQEAVTEADYIQESAPEREDLKQNILADIDKYAKSEAVIASSTSGYK